MNELISVIIPVYNAERTIARCIDSVLAQTHTEIEAICIVDGGTDGSAEILYHLAEADPRIRIIEQESRGPATARNAGLDAAKGMYIGFVDADDCIDKTMFEVLLKDIRETDAELANIGRCNFFQDGIEKTVAPGFEGVFDVNSPDALGRLIAVVPDFIWDKLFRAHIIKENGIRFPDGRVYGEDTVFLVKYLSHVKKAVFRETPLYYYNAHSEGSITNTISDRWYDIFENLKEILFYYRENLSEADFTAVAPYLEDLCILYYDRRANALIRYGERGFQMRYVKYSFEFLSQNFADWKGRMKKMDGVVLPGVKTNLLLMRIFILAPEFIKTRYAKRAVR